MRTSGWADFSSALRDVGQLKAAAVTGLSDAACLAKGFFMVISFIWSFHSHIVILKKRPTILLVPHAAKAHALSLKVLKFPINRLRIYSVNFGNNLAFNYQYNLTFYV